MPMGGLGLEPQPLENFGFLSTKIALFCDQFCSNSLAKPFFIQDKKKSPVLRTGALCILPILAP